MLLVDSAKHVFWRYPAPASSTAMPFRFDDDTFFGPRHDRIISNQEDQDTIQIIWFPGGRILWRYGHVNVKGSAPGFLNTPDDAYLLTDGLVTVADAYNCRVLFVNTAHKVVREYGNAKNCTHDPPHAFGPINGATPLSDGGTLVSEINGSWIDNIGANGSLRWAVHAPVSYPSDPQLLGRSRILLADYANPGHVLIMTRAGRVVWRYGPASGAGKLDHPSLATQITPDLLAINDDFRDRVVLVSISKRRIVWQYGHTDRPGRANGYLNTPDGLDLLRTGTAQQSRVIRALLSKHRQIVPGRPATPKSSSLRISTPGFRLPAPIQREVAVATARGILIAGGLDAAGLSTNGVFLLAKASGHLTYLGSVPQPFHDAAGAVLGSKLIVFGGGASASSSTVEQFDLLTHRGGILARLPHPLSDLAAATVGNAVYLVGGYDGKTPRPEIWRTTDGVHYQLAARLPNGLRYTAVAAVGPEVVIAGGISVNGPSAFVYSLDTRTDQIRLLGRLPHAVGHATAVTVGRFVYVLGGSNTASSQAGTITRVDVSRDSISTEKANYPISDAASVSIDGQAWIIGGTRGGAATGRIEVARPSP